MAKNPYVLNINGLDAGEYLFSFELDKSFLNFYPIEEVSDLTIQVNANLIKQNNVMKVDFDVVGSVVLPCDRCLARNPFPINHSESLVIKFGEPINSNDEVIFVENGETEIGIGNYLYEYLFTAIPARKITCEVENNSAECDESVLRKLKENITFDDSSQENSVWEGLKKLRNNKN
jgi:uncharacterized metal-binding protein YceD (DUF177 family)